MTIQMKGPCLYLHMVLFVLENEIWKSGRNLPLTTFGSERLKGEKTHFRLMCVAQKVAV